MQLMLLSRASPLARRPPNGLPEELLVVGILVSGMAVAGLDIDYASAFVSLGPGDDVVALGLIRGQQRVAFPGDVEPLVGLIMSVEVAQSPRHRMIRVGNMDAEIHAFLPGRARLEHAVDIGRREVIMRADDVPV